MAYWNWEMRWILLLQGMSQLFCEGLSSIQLFCESYFPYPSKGLLVLTKCYWLMNYVE